MIGIPSVFVGFLFRVMGAVVGFVKRMIMCDMAMCVGCVGVKISVSPSYEQCRFVSEKREPACENDSIGKP